jgi:hypothetical protein
MWVGTLWRWQRGGECSSVPPTEHPHDRRRSPPLRVAAGRRRGGAARGGGGELIVVTWAGALGSLCARLSPCLLVDRSPVVPHVCHRARELADVGAVRSAALALKAVCEAMLANPHRLDGGAPAAAALCAELRSSWDAVLRAEAAPALSPTGALAPSLSRSLPLSPTR